MVHLAELPAQNEHPVAAELASLKAAIAQFQNEAHSSSLKLQRHTLDSARIHERLAQLERENSLLKTELMVLRANPHPDSLSSHPAVLQVQQLTLSLRALSNKLTLTEEALLECTDELEKSRNETLKAKHTTDRAYELAANVRGREEEGKQKLVDLEWKLKEAEEKVKLSDLVLKEYADLVRSLEGRPSIRSPMSASFPQFSSTMGENGSPALTSSIPSPSGSIALAECLAEGKVELNKLVTEFREQIVHLQTELEKTHNELLTLRTLHEAERKAVETDRTELSRTRHELKLLQLDDNTAAKMVSRYMKFSQKSTDMLQQAMQTLKTRQEATVDTLSSQMVSLSEKLRESEAMTDRLRNSLDEVGGDLMKESYGRRREARLRIRLVNREEQIQEALKRWIRGSEEALRRVEGDERVHEPLLSMVQDAKIVLESLDGPITDTTSLSGSLARMLAMQSMVDGLFGELQTETTRRIELGKIVPVIAANLPGSVEEKRTGVPVTDGLEKVHKNILDSEKANGGAHGMKKNGIVGVDGSHSPPPPPPPEKHLPHPQVEAGPLSESHETPSVQAKAAPSPMVVVPASSHLLVDEAELLVTQAVINHIPVVSDAPSGGSTSPIEALAPVVASSYPLTYLEDLPTDKDVNELSNAVTSSINPRDFTKSEPLDELSPSTAVRADNSSHVDNLTPPALPEPLNSMHNTTVNVEPSVELSTGDVNNSTGPCTGDGVFVSKDGEDGPNEGLTSKSLSSQLFDGTVIIDTSSSPAENANTHEDHADDISAFNSTASSLNPATGDVPSLTQSNIPDDILGSPSTQPVTSCDSINNVPSSLVLGNRGLESQSYSQVQADSVVISDVFQPSPKSAHELVDIAKVLEESVASHELPSTISVELSDDSSSIPDAAISLEAGIPSASGVRTPVFTTLEPSSSVSLKYPSSLLSENVHQSESSLAPEAEPTVPKLTPHPLLQELAQVGRRYDDLQRALRDCHMALEALKKSVSTSPAAVSAPPASSLSKQTRTIGGMPSEVLTTMLDRLTDYTEDARVELEIKTSDEALLAKGYETLLSVPGAISSDTKVEGEDEDAGPMRLDVEKEVRAFVEGTEPSIQKAHGALKQKLDNLQHDIAALKQAIHNPDVDDTTLPFGTLSPGKSDGAGGWTSWVRGPSSRLSSPAPGSAASATFGNIMTTPRLRQVPSLNFQSLKKSGPSTDPVARLGLRVPMPSFALHMPSSNFPSSPPRSRTVSTMYMLGLSALRSPSRTLGSSATPQRQPSPVSGMDSGTEAEANDSETEDENTDIE